MKITSVIDFVTSKDLKISSYEEYDLFLDHQDWDLDSLYIKLPCSTLSFPKCLRVEKVFLDCENLVCIPQNFYNLRNCKELKLVSSAITELGRSYNFAQGPDLKKLCIVGKICYLYKYIFRYLSQLEELHLEYCRLKFLPDTIGQAKKLKHLILKHGILHDLPASLLNCSLLEKVNLSNNFFTSIPTILSQMPKLHSIDLGLNRIDTIPSWMEYNSNIKNICLTYTVFESFPNSFVENNPHLNEFIFSSTSIERGREIIISKNSFCKIVSPYVIVRFSDDEHRKFELSNQFVDEKIPDEFKCPITKRIMIDPVMTSLGHTYERFAIEKWFETSSIEPRTGEINKDKKVLLFNHVCSQLISNFLDELVALKNQSK